MAQLVKNPPVLWETWVRSLGWEDPLEMGKAKYSVLENCMDCIVHGVLKSWTWLCYFSLHFQCHTKTYDLIITMLLLVFSLLVMSNSLQLQGLYPTSLLCPRNSPGKNAVWLAIPFSRGSSYPGMEPASPALASWFFTTEPPGKPHHYYIIYKIIQIAQNGI